MAAAWESAPLADAPAVAPAPQAQLAQAPVAPATAGPAPKAAWESAPLADAPAPAAAPQSGERSALGEMGRQIGLTGRMAVNAAAAIPGMVSDGITGPINAGLDAVVGEGKGFRFQKIGNAVNNIMDGVGVAKPANATERIIQDIGTGAATAATGVGIGAGLAKTAAGPISSIVGKGLQQAAGVQAGSGALGGGAAGVTREAGGSEGAQMAAGIIGSLAPTASSFAGGAAARGIARGGEAGRARMAENIATFESATGTAPTLGQATGSRTIQAVETGLANTVGSSGRMIRRGEAQAEAMAASVRKLAEQLAPGANGMEAGEAIARGVNGFKGSFKATQTRLYGALDQHIAPQMPIGVGKTQQALKDLTADIPGAPNLSQFFKNGKISAIDRALLADLDAAGKAQAPVGMSSTGMAPTEGQLPYQAIKKLRTLIGNEIADGNLVSDVPRSKWSALYAALSDDLGAAATAAGPKAEQAWSRANAYTRTGMQRLEQLNGIVSRDAPEHVFRAAMSGTAEGGTTIRRVMRSLPVENRREVAAAALQRLGRAKPGQQNELGDEFSSETFLTNLATLSPQARQALFGSSGFDGLEKKINQLGKVASMRRDGAKVFSNPSGTARQGGMLAWAATLLGGIASGNPLLISGALGSATAANIGARVATNAAYPAWLAQKTVASPAMAPAAIAASARTATPPTEAKEPALYKSRMAAGKALREAGGQGELLQTEEGWMLLPSMPRIEIPDEQPDEPSPTDGAQAPTPDTVSQAPENHINALKRDPSTAAMFDLKYGPGASQRYLEA